MSMDEQEILTRTLAVLDTNIARRANQIARMVWPDQKFNTQQAACIAVRRYLTQLAHQRLAHTTFDGWRKTKLPR